MRKCCITVLALCVCCTTTSASPRRFYKNWKWWVGESVLIGAVVADGRSTCLGYERGLVERNVIGRGSTNCGHAIAVLTGGLAVYTTLHAVSYEWFKDDPSRGWRTASLVTVPAIDGGIHTYAAIHNYEILPPKR